MHVYGIQVSEESHKVLFNDTQFKIYVKSMCIKPKVLMLAEIFGAKIMES